MGGSGGLFLKEQTNIFKAAWSIKRLLSSSSDKISLKDQNPKKKSGSLEDQARRHRGFPRRKHLSGDLLMKMTKTKFFVRQSRRDVSILLLRHTNCVRTDFETKV